jgi:hypothetical protein
VYRGSGPYGALASFYAGGDAVLLAPLGDRMYMINDDGLVYRLNDADAAFEAHYTPLREFSPRWAGAFRGSLVVAGRHVDGSLHFYRLPPYAGTEPTYLHELAYLHNATGMYRTGGVMFTLHNDDLYFSPGYYTRPTALKAFDLYRFTGSRIDRIANALTMGAGNPATWGLLSWQGELLFAAPQGAGNPNVQILVGNRFQPFLQSSTIDVTTPTVPIVAVANGSVLLTGIVGANQGIYHAGTGSFQDGYLVTSYLDMGHPGRKKRLHRLTLYVDDATAATTLTLAYRIDDTDAYTTAATATAALASLSAELTASAVEFYRLQVKASLADSSVTAQDIKIVALSCHYSVGDG